MTCNPFLEAPANLFQTDVTEEFEKAMDYSYSVTSRFDMEEVKKTTLLISNLVNHPNTDLSEFPNLKEKVRYIDFTSYEIAEFLDDSFYTPAIVDNILKPYDFSSLTYSLPTGTTFDQAVLKQQIAIVQPSVGAKNILKKIENFLNGNVASGISSALCGAIQNVFSKIGDLKDAFGKISGVLDKLSSFNIGAIFSSLLGKLNIAKEMLGKVVDKIVEQAKQTLENLKSKVKGLAGKARAFFNGKMKDLKSFFSGDIVKNIKTKIEGFVDQLSAQFPTPTQLASEFMLFRVCQMMTSVQDIMEGPMKAIESEIKQFAATKINVQALSSAAMELSKVAGLPIKGLDLRKKEMEEVQKFLNEKAIQMSNVAPKLQAGLQNALGVAAPQLGAALTGLSSNITGGLAASGGALSQNFSGLTNNLTANLQGALGTVSTSLSGDIGKALNGLSGGLTGEVRNTLNSLSTNLSGLPTSVTGVLGASLQGVSTNLTGNLGVALNGLSGSLQGELGSAVRNIGAGLSGDFGKALNNISGNFGSALNGISGPLGNAISGITTNLTAGIGNLPSALKASPANTKTNARRKPTKRGYDETSRDTTTAVELQPVSYSSLDISLEEWDWVTSLVSKDNTKDPDVHWSDSVANMGKISTNHSGGSGPNFNPDHNYYSEEDGIDAGIDMIVKKNPQLLVWVRRAAKRMGRTLYINSAFRSVYYNLNVLKAKTGKNSPHSKAKALDLSLGGFSSKEKALLIKFCSMEGFDRISYYPKDNFIHVDIAAKRVPGGAWQSRDGGDKYIREAIQNHLHDRYRRG